MTELAALHHRCRGYFAKGIETHYHGVKHDCQVTPCVELLYILNFGHTVQGLADTNIFLFNCSNLR